jgi:hypothetical protein
VKTRVGVGVVLRSSDGLVLVGRRLAEPGRPLAITGVVVDLDVAADDAAPLVRQPERLGELAWIDPARPPEGVFTATAALLERLA